MDDYVWVGKSPPRYDGIPKTTGRRYATDI